MRTRIKKFISFVEGRFPTSKYLSLKIELQTLIVLGMPQPMVSRDYSCYS